MALVRVNQGGKIAEVRREGASRALGKPSGRGTCVTLAFWCEDGHTFERDYQFHKGGVYVADTPGASFSPEHDSVPELWRD